MVGKAILKKSAKPLFLLAFIFLHTFPSKEATKMKHSFETVIYPDMIICSMLSHLAMDNDNSYTTPSSSRQKLWHHSRILLHLIKHKENHAEGLVHLPTFPFHTISGLLQFRTNLRNLTNRLANIQKTPTSVERTMISIYFVSYTSIF